MPALPRLRNPLPHIEARIHRALAEGRAERDAQYRSERAGKRPTLSLSSIGDCPRKLWAGLHGIEGELPDGPRLAIFKLGEFIERMAVELLNRSDILVTRQQERVVIDFGEDRLATGRMDGVAVLKTGRFDLQEGVLEIKSANDEQWALCEAQGYDVWRPAYGDTLHAYMGASKIDTAIAVVVNKNNSKIYAEKIRFDPERYARLVDKARGVLSADRPVAKPEAATSEYCNFCKWCAVREWCWSAAADVQFDA